MVTDLAEDDRYLSSWLRHNYIGQCSQLSPDNISQLFDDVSSNTGLQKAASEIVRWILNCMILNCMIYGRHLSSLSIRFLDILHERVAVQQLKIKHKNGCRSSSSLIQQIHDRTVRELCDTISVMVYSWCHCTIMYLLDE